VSAARDTSQTPSRGRESVPFLRRAPALVIGLIGAAIAITVSLPLPWLLGPMLACVVVSLAGAQLPGPGLLLPLLRTSLGLAIGASFTPALLERVDQMALSLALVPAYVLLVGGLGYPFFRHFCGFDKPTAYYSAMPGGLSDMAAFGAEAGADLRILSLVHATRVLVVVSVLPYLIEFSYGISARGVQAPGMHLAAFSPGELALMAALGLGGWYGAVRLRLSGASIIGPMLLGGAASMSGLLQQRPPVELVMAAQLMIGVAVGVTYAGTTRALLVRAGAAAVGYCVLLGGIAAAFTAADRMIGVPTVDALLAFAPGGQAEMTVLALVLGADVAFVALHHIARVFIVVLGAPLVHRYLR